jgi:competence protein ComEC
VVRTANRTILYDAGPRYASGSDSGERLVAPYLRATGTSRLDAMVITHNDADHAGGAVSVAENFEVDELISSLPSAHPLGAAVPFLRRCQRGAEWQWDGVRFAFLHPDLKDPAPRKANDLSCVLRVSVGERAMLLTGDIERLSEERLVSREPRTLAADVLLVPHHGSRTSSSEEFLDAVRPSLAIVPAGYRNRFGHPGAEVLARYTAINARVLRTDRDGAVTVRMSPGGAAIQTERAQRRRYWHAGGGGPPISGPN